MFGCHSRLVVFSVIGLLSALDMSAEVLSKRSWGEAAQSCTLLGSSNTEEVQIEKINISSEVRDSLYWIGAIVNHTLWLQVVGYAQVTGPGEIVDPPSLLSCHLYCNSNRQTEISFALMNKRCYCQQQSFSAASGPRAIKYLRATLPPAKINGSIRGDCVAFTRTVSANNHQLLPCSTLLPPICESGEMSISNKNWTEAVTSCSRPAAEFIVLSAYNVDIGTTGWTGITRQNYGRIWATDSREVTSLFGCIAVDVSSGTATSLHEFPCDTNLTPLCEHGTILKGNTNEATENSDTSISSAVGLASGFGLLVILIVVGVILLKRRNKLKARRSSKVSFHNKNFEVGMEGVNIPPLYAEVEECVNSTDKTPQGNPRDSGGSDRTYDHARVQSLGRILTDDDYDHLQ